MTDIEKAPATITHAFPAGTWVTATLLAYQGNGVSGLRTFYGVVVTNLPAKAHWPAQVLVRWYLTEDREGRSWLGGSDEAQLTRVPRVDPPEPVVTPDG